MSSGEDQDVITDKFSERLAIEAQTGTQKECYSQPSSQGVRGTLMSL